MDQKSLDETVYQMLTNELSRSGDAFLTKADIDDLITERNDACYESMRSTVLSYPSSPLYKDIACRLSEWIEDRDCPYMKLPRYDLLDESEYIESRTEIVRPLTYVLTGMVTLWDHWSQDERNYKVREILMTLGKRGMLDLLGMRKTCGSEDIWPPPRHTLEESFNDTHSYQNSKLSVGARALAKHCHRDTTDVFWGKSTGNEQEKNAHASSVMNKVLDDAHWMNMHNLPQDVVAVEIRERHGYGLRWSANGEMFRGFLEPQMEGGHEVGWRH